jgi:hypothetical protein
MNPIDRALNVPHDLLPLRQWVEWRYIGEDKRKVPFQPNGTPAKSNDPATWSAFDECRGQLGFVFAAEDGLFGVDLDGCIDDAGEVQEWAMRIVNQFDTYAEISPSGRGIKLWGRGAMPGGTGKKAPVNSPACCDKQPAIEAYDRGRYFTFTGERLPMAPLAVNDCQEALDWLASVYWPPKAVEVKPTQKTSIQERAARYLACVDPAIAGQGGHNQTFRAACSLVLGFGLSVDEAMPLLAEYNARCEPPWSEKELLHKLESADKQTGERGVLLRDDGRHAAKGVDLSQLMGNDRERTASVDTTYLNPEKLGGCVNAQRIADLWQPFPAWRLPEPLRSFVGNASTSLGSDPAYVAATLLVSIAAAIGTTRRVCCKVGWYEFPILWVGLVGKSGCGKSPAVDVATKPIKRRQHMAAIIYKQQIDEIEASKGNLAGAKRRDESEPKMPCLYCEDSTVEALIDRLVDNPRGLVVIRDELAAWLEGMNAYKGGKGSDESTWLSFFDGREAKHDRKIAKRTTLFVPRAAVSLVGGIQPGVLTECLTLRRTASGMAARLLLVHPPETVQQWSESEVDQGLVNAVNGVFDSLFDQLSFDENGQPITVRMSNEAQLMFVDHYNATKRIQGSASDHEAAILSKAIAITARLALILHMVRVATFDVALDDPSEVDHETIGHAIGLSQWFTHETLRVIQTLREPAEARREREILELVARLERESKPTSVRELMRHSRLFQGTAEEAERELMRIAASGKGHWLNAGPGDTGGRPSSHFRIGPSPR